MRKIIFILLLFFTTSLFSNRTIITVTHPVEKYFIEKIADKNIYVRVVFDKKKEFSFDNKQEVETLAYSKYYFKLNIEEEKLILEKFKAINKNLKVIDISKNINKLTTKDNKKIPFIWLDPILVRDIAKNIYEELVKIRYYDRHIFKENYENFLNEIDDIYLHIKKRLDSSEVYGFFAFNHQLDYFAKRFRLNLYHRENRYLNISEVPTLIKLSKKESLKHIIIEKDSPYEIAQSISGHINGKIIEIDIYSQQWKSNLYILTRQITNY